MFQSVEDYSFLSVFYKNASLIRKEVLESNISENLNSDGVDAHLGWWVLDNGFHPQQIGFDIRDGGYLALSLFKKDFPVRSSYIEKYFSKTLSLIDEVVNEFSINAHYSGIFIMHPSASLREHSHTRSNLIYHLLLNDLDGEGCKLTCAEEVRFLRNKYDQLLFDYSYPHSSKNLSNDIRFNFVFDFSK